MKFENNMDYLEKNQNVDEKNLNNFIPSAPSEIKEETSNIIQKVNMKINTILQEDIQKFEQEFTPKYNNILQRYFKLWFYDFDCAVIGEHEHVINWMQRLFLKSRSTKMIVWYGECRGGEKINGVHIVSEYPLCPRIISAIEGDCYYLDNNINDGVFPITHKNKQETINTFQQLFLEVLWKNKKVKMSIPNHFSSLDQFYNLSNLSLNKFYKIYFNGNPYIFRPNNTIILSNVVVKPNTAVKPNTKVVKPKVIDVKPKVIDVTPNKFLSITSAIVESLDLI
jgi:hypothetical protein